MKKILNVIIFLLLISTVNVNASTTITKTDYKDGKITVQGTGTGEIQVVLFNLNNEPMYMTTVTAVEDKFEITFPPISNLKEGTYKIKVSDYSGKNVSSREIIIKSEDNPPTVDNILIYFALAGISFIGLGFTSNYIFKKSRS